MKERRVINKWKSTLHRVLNTGDERISLVLQTCETMLTPSVLHVIPKMIKPLPDCEPAPSEAPSFLVYKFRRAY